MHGEHLPLPAVERLLAAELGADPLATAGDRSEVVVASAGVGAVVGAPVPPQMAALVEGVGVSVDGFAARQLTEAILRESDLVLALTKAHRSKIVALHPGVVRRTFTLRELARLASGVDPADLPAGTTADRLRALIPLAAAQRGLQAGATADDDVVDPWGRSDEVFAQSFDELRPAVATIARVVRS
ncbi:low molecular weight phosphatase family protein [Cellulomonas sp. ATA003]|uniref:arsenate reductase/protein-tyrosine-phosphatase family protein n=1 Tax=Cellulomonas sp. ATA003 TaxID=3073064 RepID=UPI002872C071|nr:low molecular weight phosphatase family protein [Cellulomonas sp. ATA003]WNB85216.1 low molecular weight phosphatase family protein [Cellulomonas sp. ATA003]